MKKVLIVLAFSAFLAACNDSSTTSTDATSDSTITTDSSSMMSTPPADSSSMMSDTSNKMSTDTSMKK